MSVEIFSDADAGSQSIRSSVSHLSARFHRMQALGAELQALDAVGQDVSHIHALIRRDVATAILQTAISVKDREALVATHEARKVVDAVVTKSDTQAPDLWTRRLLRWADRLGKSLFGMRKEQQTVKQTRALLPPQEH